MCEFFSCIVTKTKDVFYHDNSNCHDEIISHYKLNDGVDGQLRQLFARVEITPPNGDVFQPVEKWNFRIDETVLLNWFTEKHKKSCMVVLENYLSKYLILDQTVEEIREGRYWLKNSTVKSMRDNSTVEFMYDNSTIEHMQDNSTVKYLHDNSTVESMEDNSTVEFMQANSTVKSMRNNSTVEYMRDNSTIESMYDNSTVEYMRDNSTIESMYDNSKLKWREENEKINKAILGDIPQFRENKPEYSGYMITAY